jgi:hypothetical protein
MLLNLIFLNSFLNSLNQMAAPKKKAPETEAVALAVTPIFPVELETEKTKAVKALGKIKEIKTDEDRALADALIKDGKLIRKTIETKRFELSSPLETQKKALIAFEKDFSLPLDTEVTRLTNLVNTYIREQFALAEQKRKVLDSEEQERLKRLRSTTSIAKVQTEFEEKRADTVIIVANVRMDTKYEVTDLNQVPRELLMIDPDKVKKLLASGAESCAGLRIWKEPSRSGRA